MVKQDKIKISVAYSEDEQKKMRKNHSVFMDIGVNPLSRHV